MKIKGKIFPTIISLIFLAVGIVVLCLDVFAIVEETRYERTTATVISAEVGYSDEGKLTVVSTYEYFVDGERYVKKTKVTNANQAKFEGETFTVKYDPEQPEKGYSDDSVGIVFITVLGLAFTFMGGGALITVLTGKLN